MASVFEVSKFIFFHASDSYFKGGPPSPVDRRREMDDVSDIYLLEEDDPAVVRSRPSAIERRWISLYRS